MIYQKLHLGDPPYLLRCGSTRAFPVHKHIETELFYCIKGDTEIIIDRQKYKITAGELAVIGSMVPHEILGSKDPDACKLIVEIGPTMLGEYYKPMESQMFLNPVFDLKQKKYAELHGLFEEVAAINQTGTSFSSLLVKGNIYKISAYILSEFVSENNGSTSKKIKSINAVENALEYIYNNYDRKITINEISNACSYSKTNFCKMFKSVTDDTFHNVLNRHRIKMSCVLLENSDYSVEDIAEKVGFSDSKSFCRVFKTEKGISPGKYRQKYRVLSLIG